MNDPFNSLIHMAVEGMNFCDKQNRQVQPIAFSDMIISLKEQ